MRHPRPARELHTAYVHLGCNEPQHTGAPRVDHRPGDLYHHNGWPTQDGVTSLSPTSTRPVRPDITKYRDI
jgi:hypothetical protein